MDENEPLDHAAARELKEETSLDASQSGVVLEQVHRPSHSRCIMLISDPSCISTALAAHDSACPPLAVHMTSRAIDNWTSMFVCVTDARVILAMLTDDKGQMVHWWRR